MLRRLGLFAALSILAFASHAQTCTPPAIVQISGTNPSCSGSPVTLDAGDGWQTYEWSNGATGRYLNDAPGTTTSYSVTVTGNGCTVTSAPLEIVVNTPSIDSANSYCTLTAGQASTPDAGAGATYDWDVTNATIDAGEFSPVVTFTPAAAGDVTLTVHVATPDGCVATAQKVVTAYARPSFNIRVTQSGGGYSSAAPRVTSNADFQGTYEFCGNTTVSLLATTLDPSWTYTWSTGANGPFLQVTTSGTYTLTATAPSGCSYAKAVTINFKPAPAATISGARAICPGGTTTLTASGGMSYRWSTGATTASIVVNAAGTYSVTVTNDGCNASASATVTQNSASIAAEGPTTFCGGGSVTLTASPAQSYLWSNGATTQSITVTTSGAYSVQETFAEGCTLASNTINVSAGPTAASIAVDDTTACPGQTVTITSSVTGGANLTYQWLDENLQPIAGATSPTYVFNASGSGYGHATLRVYDANGCSIDSNQATWYVWSPVTPVITTYGPTTFCEGGMPATLESSQATTYLWSNGATTRSIGVTQPGTYTVTTTDGSGCPVTSDPVTITVLPRPAKPQIAASGPLTFCEGGSVTLTAPAGYAYQWSNGATTQSITVAQTGYYSVTVSDGSCTNDSDAVYVDVKPLPVATITGATSFCDGGSTTLTASAGTSYLWSNGATTRSITVTEGGAYFVTVSDGTCSAQSTPVNVTKRALPPSAITAPATALCPNATATLTAPAGYTYVWSTGATTRSITVSSAGTYSVTVSDGSCSSTSSIAITANAPTQIVTQPQSATINRNTTRQLSVTATGTAPLQYQWYRGTAGDTTQPLANATSSTLTVGPYTKKGTDRFWVRVWSATCPASSVDSATAVITIN